MSSKRHLIELWECIDLQKYSRMPYQIINLISKYDFETWKCLLSKCLLMYDSKYRIISSRLDSAMKQIELGQLIDNLKANPKHGLLRNASSYPFVHYSYSYYSLSATFYGDALLHPHNPVAWVSGYASCIFLLIDALSFSEWENYDPLYPLAHVITTDGLDQEFWPLSSIGPEQYLKTAKPVSTFEVSVQSRIWRILHDQLSMIEPQPVADFDADKVTKLWIDNIMRPILDD